jgi:hypothetical protein
MYPIISGNRLKALSALLEPIVLYLILFLPGAVAATPASYTITFPVTGTLIRIGAYYLPGLALIWYLLYRSPGNHAAIPRPSVRDLISFGLTFLCLVGINRMIIALFPSAQSIVIELPHGPGSFVVAAALCVCTGYLEESYFRYYLLYNRTSRQLIGMIVLSTLLFALCHRYEGSAGMINAGIAGLALSAVFVGTHSFHGIALAHGCYNIAVLIYGS